MTSQDPAPIDAAAPPRNTAALVALILGIAAIVLAVIPFASYVAWILGIAAVVLGIIGLTRQQRGRRGSAISGVVLGGLAIVLSIVLSIVYTVVFFLAAVSHGVSGISGFPTALPTDLRSILPTDPGGSLPTASPTPGERSVTYRVTGTGRAESITYVVLGGSDRDSGSGTVDSAELPWSQSIAIGDDSSTVVFSLIAQRGSGAGTIGCAIESGGRALSTKTASGPHAVVACGGSTTSG